MKAPSQAFVIDGTDKHVTPGLIDCHVHVTAASANLSEIAEWSPLYLAARASTIMRGMLQRGFTTFSYTLIPLSDSSKATPAIPFCYFDPKKGAYVDLTIPPVPLTVRPAPPGTIAKAQPTQATAPGPDADESSSRERELILTGLAETPGHSVGSLVPLQLRGWFLAFAVALTGASRVLRFFFRRLAVA